MPYRLCACYGIWNKTRQHCEIEWSIENEASRPHGPSDQRDSIIDEGRSAGYSYLGLDFSIRCHLCWVSLLLRRGHLLLNNRFCFDRWLCYRLLNLWNDLLRMMAGWWHVHGQSKLGYLRATPMIGHEGLLVNLVSFRLDEC